MLNKNNGISDDESSIISSEEEASNSNADEVGSDDYKKNNNWLGADLIGKLVSTEIGIAGKVCNYRERDGIYTIQFTSGTIYCTGDRISLRGTTLNSTTTSTKDKEDQHCCENGDKDSSQSKAEDISTTNSNVGAADSSGTSGNCANTSDEGKNLCRSESEESDDSTMHKKKAMELNHAYKSMEKMRRLNLEIECSNRVIECIDFECCTTCLLSGHMEQQKKEEQQRQRQRQQNKIGRGMFSNLQTFRQLVDVNVNNVNKQMKMMKPKPKPEKCLVCASPACASHSCPAFRKEGITVCMECVKLFQLDFIVNCVTEQDAKEREKCVDWMIDRYDRALLLLRYSAQYIEPIAQVLETNTKKTNAVNVTSSSAGIVSGALGVAAAATIFTPAGPPLLIASLLFGGGATAVQTGTEVVNYFSEPRKLADRIIALHGIVHSILRVTDTLQEALTRDIINMAEQQEKQNALQNIDKALKDNETAVLAGSNMARTALLSGAAMGRVASTGVSEVGAGLVAETGMLATRNASLVSKTGTAVARGARFARFAGGALSAATLLLEARTISETVSQIRAGNPCEKAQILRQINLELSSKTLPSSEALDQECQIYLGALKNRLVGQDLEDALSFIEKGAQSRWEREKKREQQKPKIQHNTGNQSNKQNMEIKNQFSNIFQSTKNSVVQNTNSVNNLFQNTKKSVVQNTNSVNNLFKNTKNSVVQNTTSVSNLFQSTKKSVEQNALFQKTKSSVVQNTNSVVQKLSQNTDKVVQNINTNPVVQKISKNPVVQNTNSVASSVVQKISSQVTKTTTSLSDTITSASTNAAGGPGKSNFESNSNNAFANDSAVKIPTTNNQKPNSSNNTNALPKNINNNQLNSTDPTLILEAEDEEVEKQQQSLSPSVSPISATTNATSTLSQSTLLERIQKFKEEEAAARMSQSLPAL